MTIIPGACRPSADDQALHWEFPNTLKKYVHFHVVLRARRRSRPVANRPFSSPLGVERGRFRGPAKTRVSRYQHIHRSFLESTNAMISQDTSKVNRAVLHIETHDQLREWLSE